MKMVTHHSIGVYRDCETLGNQDNALFNPDFAMFKALAGVVINTA
jgi:hypothetical protein